MPKLKKVKTNTIELTGKYPMIIYAFPNDNEHEYDLKCIYNAKNLNLNVYDALQVIRTRLKYGQDVTDIEQETLEQLRKLLGEYYVEG